MLNLHVGRNAERERSEISQVQRLHARARVQSLPREQQPKAFTFRLDWLGTRGKREIQKLRPECAKISKTLQERPRTAGKRRL